MSGWPERILYLCADRGVPYGGRKGSAVHIREFLDALKKAGGRAAVLVVNRAGGAAQSEPFCVHSIDSSTLEDFQRFWADRGDQRQVAREARDFALNWPVEQKLKEIYADDPFDLIYERYSLFGVAGRAFAALRGIPHILEVNAPLVLEAGHHRTLVSTELAQNVERYLFETCDQVIAVSQSLQQYVREVAPAQDVSVVPNGVDPSRFTLATEVSSTGSSGAPCVIGFVGRVRPWHGVDRMIELLPQLVDEVPHIRLLIVGDAGDSEAYLRARGRELGVTGHIELAGAVAPESIPDYLARIDVAVAPYPEMPLFYFSPLKVFEYMAAGKAIVASAIGQLASILRHEENALLVPPGDNRALGLAIRRLCSDPSLRHRLGRNARAEAMSRHTWSQRMEVIREVMARATSGKAVVAS